jgi:hypothetical protein
MWQEFVDSAETNLALKQHLAIRCNISALVNTTLYFSKAELFELSAIHDTVICYEPLLFSDKSLVKLLCWVL